jgi:protein-tyrosine phosphatase
LDGAPAHSRRLEWPACSNARDLGGLSTPGGVTRFGVMVRSDHVGHLTARGREAVTAYGVTTVIDLRSPAELLSSPNPFAAASGPRHLHVPLVDDASMRGLGEASNMFERYLLMLDGRQHAFRDVFQAIAAAQGGVLVHCFAGKDRTGLVAAMMLAMAGVPEDEIAADFAETDLQLAARYESWIAGAAPGRRAEMREELRCPPDRILGVVEHLEAGWGGVEGYLEAAGVGSENLARLREKLA